MYIQETTLDYVCVCVMLLARSRKARIESSLKSFESNPSQIYGQTECQLAQVGSGAARQAR